MANKKKKRSFGKALGSGAGGSVAYDLLLNEGQGVLDFTQALLRFMFKEGV